MATENPRIQVMLDQQTNNLLANLAKKQHRSLSSTAANLIKEALELYEDSALSHHGDQRLDSTKRWISHQDAWK